MEVVEQAERKLALVQSGVLDDWYCIEWAEHEHRSWFDRTEPNVMALRWSGRVADADVEGTASEMRAIADAIERGESVGFYRCEAARQEDGSYLLGSPRNSTEPARISAAQAAQLAAAIRAALPQK